MQGRGHGKERQMDYEGVNTSFARDVGVCLCVITTGISLVNARKAHRDTVGTAAVVKASAHISVIRAGVR